MFVGACFPIADLREFVATPTGRLLRPTWPNADVGADFVRGCGPVERRRRGGPEAWPGEHAYVRSDRLLRFHGPLGGDTSDVAVHGAECTFRRLYCAPPAAVRFEVGFRLNPAIDTADPSIPLTAVLPAVASIPIANGSEALNLVGAGPVLARRFLAATTERATSPPEKWWAAAATPLFLVETVDGRVVEQLRAIGAVQGTQAPENVDLLHYFDEKVGAHVWCIVHKYGFARPSTDVRDLRIHLVRLHEERETLKRVLQMVSRKKIAITRGEASSDRLETYLARAAKVLQRETLQGISVEPTLQTAYGADTLVNEGEMASLRDALQDSRHQVATVLEHVIEIDRNQTTEQTVVSIYAARLTVNNDNSTHIDMSNSTNTGVNIAVGSQISQTIGNVENSNASEDIKTTLTEIHDELQKLLPQMNEETQKDAAKSFDRLAEEAVAEKPDRKWYEVSAEGLLEAANAVADAGKPLVGLIGKLLGLLA